MILVLVLSLLFAIFTPTISGPVTLLLDGAPAIPGDYPFHDSNGYRKLILNNQLLEFEFGAVQNTLPSAYFTMSAIRVTHLATGIELANNVSGSQNDGEQHMSFYVDWQGGPNRYALICDTVRIVRNNASLAEIAFIDSTNTPLRNEHHIIMTASTSGLYGYNIMTVVQDYGLNEVRMNTRWNRCLFNRAYNWERGYDQKQPTYAYLFTQQKLSDETWRVDGKNNASLPCPLDNDGDLPAGTVYTKYDWSLYHWENPMFGHMGQDSATGNYFGAWWTPLTGVSGKTSVGGFGVGPNRQDLAIHQDAIILGYFSPNHYGTPSYNVRAGYKRLYGPWLTFVNYVPPTSSFDELIADATTVANTNIAQSFSSLPFIDNQPLYYLASNRSNVTGTITVTDNRSGGGIYVLLTPFATTDIYTVKEPTYFVISEADGSFVLPGIPAGYYNLFVFAASGTITDQYIRNNINVVAPTTRVDVTWTPSDATFTHIFAIGQVDRFGTEFNLGSTPRSYDHWRNISGTLTFTVGKSLESVDWYYCQAAPGVWTVSFDLPNAIQGRAHLRIAASGTGGNAPRIAVNGDGSGITGGPPGGNDGSMSRQVVRSGHPEISEATFDASRLKQGTNTITFTRTAAAGANGLMWDALVLAIDENNQQHPTHAEIEVDMKVSSIDTTGMIHAAIIIRNIGRRAAMDVRLTNIAWRSSTNERMRVSSVFSRGIEVLQDHIPVASFIAPNSMMIHEVQVAAPPSGAHSATLELTIYADGGRTRVLAQSIVAQ